MRQRSIFRVTTIKVTILFTQAASKVQKYSRGRVDTIFLGLFLLPYCADIQP